MKVEIKDIDHKGNGIGRIENKVQFIPKCIPGDCVDVEIVKSHKKYDEGRVREIIHASCDRIDSICPYYEKCGGCHISNLNYGKQLDYKKNKVINIFKKYLNMDIRPEIIGSDNRYEYRNKITYQSRDGLLGLVSIDNDFQQIDYCFLVSDRVNALYTCICKNDLSKVSKVVIRECDNGCIVSVDGMLEIENIRDKCLAIYMNGKCVSKKEDGYIKIGDIRYIVSNQSFFQVNTGNINRLYDVIKKYGDFKKSDRLIDLYCGVGSISLYLAQHVSCVLGIEIVPDAIIDANKNKEINGIKNVEFICGDVSKLIDEHVDYNVVVVDPPRAGLDNHTISVLNDLHIDKLLYVSCDPMTLVRDLGKLENYELKDITLVDMFPQTYHVECCSLLCLKEN